jgi:hypothetical protein
MPGEERKRKTAAQRPICVVFALSLVLFGCTPIGWVRVSVNEPLTPDKVDFIVPGKTRWEDVIRRLGAPDEIDEVQRKIIADYFFYDGRDFWVDLGQPLNYFVQTQNIPHNFTLGGREIGVNTFEVAFDSSKIVQYACFVRGKEAARYVFWPLHAPDAENRPSLCR